MSSTTEAGPGAPGGPTPVVVAGGSVVHAGVRRGSYASGNPRWGKLCGGAGRDRHDPSPAPGAEITCKRCLAKLAERAQGAPGGAPVPPDSPFIRRVKAAVAARDALMALGSHAPRYGAYGAPTRPGRGHLGTFDSGMAHGPERGPVAPRALGYLANEAGAAVWRAGRREVPSGESGPMAPGAFTAPPRGPYVVSVSAPGGVQVMDAGSLEDARQLASVTLHGIADAHGAYDVADALHGLARAAAVAPAGATLMLPTPAGVYSAEIRWLA